MRKIAALLLCGALAGAQDSQDLEEFAKQFEKVVAAGQLRRVLDIMPGEAGAQLGESPVALRCMAAAGAKWARKHAKGDPSSWTRFVALLDEACQAIPEAKADCVDACVARAETLLCRARVHATLGEPFRKEDWTGAAEHFLALHAADPGGGEYLERVVRILREGAATGGEDAADLRARAGALCLEGAKKFRSNRFFARARYRAQLDQIDALAKKSAPQAKKMLKAYLASLVEPAGPSAKEVNTGYNDAVTFARNHKRLGLKPKYRTERVRISIVELEIPLSTRWETKGQRIHQYDEAGELKRTFRFDTYSWDTNYYIGRQNFGGDNIKGLARIGETDVLSVILNVKYRRKLRRGRLSRAIPNAQIFVIGGFDEDGKYLCYRSYYFKAKKTRMRSVEVSILELGEYEKLDPAAAFVLSSIRE